MPNAKMGTETKNIAGRVGCTAKLITIENINISGLLTAVLIIIINDI